MEQETLTAVEAVENCAVENLGAGPAASDERREPPPPALIPGWRCVLKARILAQGEEGFVDLAALHPARGVALLALLEADEEASPEEARAALRTMLVEAEFERRFPGDLPVVALVQRRREVEQLAAAVERAFAALPRPSVAEDWVDWLAERLSPAAADESPRPCLMAPARDETAPERVADAPLLAPPSDEEPPAAEAIAVPAEAPPQSVPPLRSSWLDWGTTLGLAAGAMLALFAALALFAHARPG